MGDFMLRDCRIDIGGSHFAQADVGACDHAHRPGEDPAIAVEHGHSPEIYAVAGHLSCHDIACGEQVSATMVIDDALGIAGGA